jgi:hypothetical protein
MPLMTDQKLYEATTSFASLVEGRPVVLVKMGQVVPEDDPVRKGHEQLFKPYEVQRTFEPVKRR